MAPVWVLAPVWGPVRVHRALSAPPLGCCAPGWFLYCPQVGLRQRLQRWPVARLRFFALSPFFSHPRPFFDPGRFVALLRPAHQRLCGRPAYLNAPLFRHPVLRLLKWLWRGALHLGWSQHPKQTAPKLCLCLIDQTADFRTMEKTARSKKNPSRQVIVTIPALLHNGSHYSISLSAPL